jgi:hypothetical protein
VGWQPCRWKAEACEPANRDTCSGPLLSLSRRRPAFLKPPSLPPLPAPSLVSRAGAGVKGDKLRQFMAINGRPVELPRAVRALNDTYK